MSDELTARRVRKTKDARLGARFADLMPSLMLTLSERDLSPKTLEVYERTGAQFTEDLADNGLPDDTEGIAAQHIRALLAAETARTSAQRTPPMPRWMPCACGRPDLRPLRRAPIYLPRQPLSGLARGHLCLVTIKPR